MADDALTRQRRHRAHERGDHRSCRGDCERLPDAVLGAVRRELTAAGQLETSLGGCALVLAERIDQSSLAQGLAGLVRELMATMAAVGASVPRSGRLEELRERAARARRN